MTITSINTDIYPGAIVRVARFPFFDTNESKPRYAFVIRREGNTVLVRGIYSNHYRGRARIKRTRRNALDHDSYLDSRIVRIKLANITRYVGETHSDYDPFNDFPTSTAA